MHIHKIVIASFVLKIDSSGVILGRLWVASHPTGWTCSTLRGCVLANINVSPDRDPQ